MPIPVGIRFGVYEIIAPLGGQGEWARSIAHMTTRSIEMSRLSYSYFDEIRAPHKQFILIRNSGHLAAFSRPEQFLDELVQHVRPFARSK